MEGETSLRRVKETLTPLPHLFPRLDEFLDVTGTGEMTRTDPAGEMGAPVEVLDGGPAHHL